MMRVGIGYDIHRMIEGDHIFLGGVRIPCSFSLKGHSDADVASHAVTDAVLGALGEKDIGHHFPDQDPKNKNRSSQDFLNFAYDLMVDRGFLIANMDINIICERPKIRDYRDQIENNFARIFHTLPQQINIKGKTNEGLGFIGEGKAISAQAIVLLESNS